MVNELLAFMLGALVCMNVTLMVVYARTSKMIIEQAERIKELADRKEATR